jgi:hypothetical protein
VPRPDLEEAADKSLPRQSNSTAGSHAACHGQDVGQVNHVFYLTIFRLVGSGQGQRLSPNKAQAVSAKAKLNDSANFLYANTHLQVVHVVVRMVVN